MHTGQLKTCFNIATFVAKKKWAAEIVFLLLVEETQMEKTKSYRKNFSEVLDTKEGIKKSIFPF